MKSEYQLRKDLVEVCHRLYQRQLIVAADGNVSCRLPGGRFLTTPTGACKGELRPEDLVVVDPQGHKLGGRNQPSTEFDMHLTAYQERPDVDAVVHAHPPTATAFSVAGVSLDRPILTEVVLTLGGIPTTPYGTPGTPEVGAAIRSVVRHADAFLLDHHGAVTVGRDLYEAFYRMETVEQTAKVMCVAHQLGGAIPLTQAQVAPLRGIREQAVSRVIPAARSFPLETPAGTRSLS